MSGPARKTRQQADAEFLESFAELAEEAGMQEAADDLREEITTPQKTEILRLLEEAAGKVAELVEAGSEARQARAAVAKMIERERILIGALRTAEEGLVRASVQPGRPLETSSIMLRLLEVRSALARVGGAP